MEITIKDKKKSSKYSVSQADTIGKIKQKLSAEKNVPIETIILVFAAK